MNLPITAVNLSYYWNPQSFTPQVARDGSFIESQAIDYFTTKFDTLFTIAKGNDPSAGNKLRSGPPSDSYNGIIVGGSADKDGIDGLKFDAAANFNIDTADDGRRLIDVVAPAQYISVPEYTPDGIGKYQGETGTSLAAPHVVGAVALLHEFVNTENNIQTLGPAGHNHLVMTSAIMNSADKIDGVLNGMRLISTARYGGKSWLDSDARDTKSNAGGAALPLDLNIGTGAVDVKRAVTQVANRYRAELPDNPINDIAWNYSTITRNATDPSTLNRYEDAMLSKNESPYHRCEPKLLLESSVIYPAGRTRRFFHRIAGH
jgi:subtilisin family serine protease